MDDSIQNHSFPCITTYLTDACSGPWWLLMGAVRQLTPIPLLPVWVKMMVFDSTVGGGDLEMQINHIK